MKFLSEYRDQKAAEQFSAAIRQKVTRPWTIMEICGGQTHTIVKSGLEDLLPKEITLVHGPGCPVCVTPIELIDKAVAIAKRPSAIFCSFGDMLRVPGSSKSLFDAKAEGADVRIVYSPLDALKLAKQNPDKQVVFFAVGFETTAPANAMELKNVKRGRIRDYADKFKKAIFMPTDIKLEHNPLWNIKADCAFPSATQNEITAKDAANLLKNGIKLVAEGANMPSTLEATKMFLDAKILYGPAKAANAGGVATSGLEMAQNSARLSWTREEVDDRLHKIMIAIHQNCFETAEKYGTPGNLVNGANIGGFVKVANAMLDQGLV